MKSWPRKRLRGLGNRSWKTLLSLLHGTLTTDVSDPILWTQFLPFPLDLLALRLYTDKSRHLHHLVLEMYRQLHRDQDGLGAPPLALLVTAVEDGLQVQRQATGAVMLAVGRSHDHLVQLRGQRVKTILSASRIYHGARVVRGTYHNAEGLRDVPVPDHLVQILEVRIRPASVATGDTEIDLAAKIVEACPGVQSVQECPLSVNASLHESAA